MSSIRAGIELFLRDGFSQGIRRAAREAEGFGTTVKSALDRVDSAFSGISGTLAAVGVSVGAAFTVNRIVKYSDAINRMGIAFNISAAETAKLKDQIYAVATAPDVKVSPEGLLDSINQIAELTGDVKFATDNMRTLGLVMQATGATGAEVGAMTAEFQKMGLSVDETMRAISTFTAQGKEGAFTLAQFAGLAPRLTSAYRAAGRSGVQAAAELGAALQVIRQGTGTSEQAATAFEAMMRNLTDPVKQEKLRRLGIEVRDQAGNFKPITILMEEIVKAGDGSLETLGRIFDAEAMRSFNAAIAEYQETGAVESLREFMTIQDDGTALMGDAARGASSLKSNLENLNSSVMKFADTALTGPLQMLTDLLNKLAENPAAVQATLTTIAVGLGAIAAVKIGSGIMNFIGSIRGIGRGGRGGLSPLGGGGVAGGATPVFVTNMPAGGMMGAGGGGGGRRKKTPMVHGGGGRRPPAGGAGWGHGRKKTPMVHGGGGRRLPAGGAGWGRPPAGGGAGWPKPAAGGGGRTPGLQLPKAAGGAKGLQLLRGAGGAAKGLGIAGTVLGLGLSAVDIATIAGDESLTQEEKGAGIGASAGGALGSLGGAAAGAAIGTLLLPGIGTILGGMLGAWLGGQGGAMLGEAVGGAVTRSGPTATPTPSQIRGRPPGSPATSGTPGAMASPIHTPRPVRGSPPPVRGAVIPPEAARTLAQERARMANAAINLPPQLRGEIQLNIDARQDPATLLRIAEVSNTSPLVTRSGPSGNARMARTMP